MNMTAVEWLIDRLEVNKMIPSPYPGEFWNILKEEAKSREMKQKVEDPIVLKVMAKYYERSQAGIKKYGKTLDRDDLELTDWLTHAQEEMMDATLYLQRIKEELKDIKEEIASSKTQSVVVKYEIK
jgi:hypothetical protein